MNNEKSLMLCKRSDHAINEAHDAFEKIEFARMTTGY